MSWPYFQVLGFFSLITNINIWTFKETKKSYKAHVYIITRLRKQGRMSTSKDTEF